jgi:hypothetical protein
MKSVGGIITKIRIALLVTLILIPLAICEQPLESTTQDKYILLDSEPGMVSHKLGSSEADFGKEYILMNFSVENCGYDEFKVEPSCFKIVINKIIYDSDYIYAMAEDGYPPLDDVTLEDGGKISGYVVYSVPDGVNEYTVRYKPYAWDNYKIKWKNSTTTT